MQIQIIGVSKPEWKEKGKSKWQEVVLTYSSGGKTSTKKVLSFDPLFNKAKEVEGGENYDVAMIKDGEYWKWTTMDKVDGVASNTAPEAGTKPQVARPSTYETPEERAKKQVYIIRQSSISAAINLLAANGGKKNTVEEVLDTAEKFAQYVIEGISLSPEEVLMSMEDDIPN